MIKRNKCQVISKPTEEIIQTDWGNPFFLAFFRHFIYLDYNGFGELLLVLRWFPEKNIHQTKVSKASSFCLAPVN
jgi:hypothetical protein